jgi:transposase InsO family protein
MSVQGNLSIEHMCRLSQVSRAGLYRFLEEQHGVEQDMELRSLIQQIAIQHRRRYGYRRITEQLHRQGWKVNHKRVQRMLREDNLLWLLRRKFVVTTQSQHGLQVRWNLAGRMQLTGINQLWVADITYLRLFDEFVYLAVILDAFSRKVVGWALGRELTSDLTLAALRQAVEQRRPPPGLVHHSDRGLQYACSEYVQLLQQHHILLSMSRAGNPYDNARCESFIKTLKQEEIYLNQYRDLEDLRAHIETFIQEYYNRCRLHSALRYQSPEEFEQELGSARPSLLSQAAGVSFFRHGEIYQCNGEQPCGHSPTHCLDESPTGYSWAGCSPAEPAYASPANAIMQDKGTV